MENNNMPIPVNPMNQIMMSGMPSLPQIIQNAMPVPLPQMQYNQNPISMLFGNFKRKRLEVATRLEADIAFNSNRALQSKLDSIHAIVTYSGRIADTLDEYEHKKRARRLFERNMELTNNKLEVEVYKLQADATTAGYEAKMSEIDYKVRLKQASEIIGEKDGPAET